MPREDGVFYTDFQPLVEAAPGPGQKPFGPDRWQLFIDQVSEGLNDVPLKEVIPTYVEAGTDPNTVNPGSIMEDGGITYLCVRNSPSQKYWKGISTPAPTISQSELDAAINELKGGATSAYDTLLELEQQFATDQAGVVALTTLVNTKASLGSPALTGTPTTPTPTTTDDSMTIANTAFVKAAMTAAGAVTIGTVAPLMDGTATAGSGSQAAAVNHVHPTDTSRAPSVHTHPASGVSDSTVAGRALLTAADAAAQRVALGLTIGTNVQAYNANLSGWAGIAQIDGSNNVGIGMVPTGSFKVEISGSLKVSTALVAGSWTMSSTTGVYLSAGSRGKFHNGVLAAGGAYPLGISSGDGVTMTGGYLFFNVDGVEQLRLTSTEARFRGPISTPNVNSSSQSNFQGNQQGGIYQAATVGYGTGGLMVQGLGVGAAAYMSFHRPGAFAMCLGLDVNNKLACGGWSMGLNSYEIYHAGNPPPNQIMAHGRVNGSTGALLRSVGVTSCTRLAAGTYEIVLAGTLPANVEVFVTTARTASNVQIGFEDDTFRSGNTIRIFTVNNAHNAEDAKFSFAII